MQPQVKPTQREADPDLLADCRDSLTPQTKPQRHPAQHGYEHSTKAPGLSVPSEVREQALGFPRDPKAARVRPSWHSSNSQSRWPGLKGSSPA